MRATFRASILGLSAFCLAVTAPNLNPQQSVPPAPVIASIDASKQSPPISKYLYGMFIEHIGSLINHGLWSEMLDDRKFYFPIKSGDPHPPGQTRTPDF